MIQYEKGELLNMKFRIIAILLLAVFMFAGCAQQRDISELTIFIAEESGSVDNSTDNSNNTENSGEDSTPFPEPEKKPEEPQYVGFFSETSVHTIDLQMPASDWNYFINHPLAKTYTNVDVVIDGEMYENAGIRTRGNTSLRWYIDYTPGKMRPPFEIKFDKYIEDRTFMGLDELSLLNVVDDRSFLREYLGYEAFRALDSFAGCVSFFNITVNGKLHGIYVGVESVDSSYLDRYFNSHKHNLYKGEPQATLLPNMAYSTLEQKKGNDTSKADLKYLTKVLNEMPLGEKGNIEDILDVDSVLKNFAVNAVIHNWDDYAGKHAHNYYLYLNDGKFYFLPWDMNESFLQWESSYSQSAGSKHDIITPLTWAAAPAETRPLVKKLLAVNEYYLRYLDYCEQLNMWLKDIDESGRLNELHDMLDEYVKNDPTKFYGYYEFGMQFNKAYYYGIAYFIHDRTAYLTKRIEQIRTANKNPITGAELIAS